MYVYKCWTEDNYVFWDSLFPEFAILCFSVSKIIFSWTYIVIPYIIIIDYVTIVIISMSIVNPIHMALFV